MILEAAEDVLLDGQVLWSKGERRQTDDPEEIAKLRKQGFVDAGTVEPGLRDIVDAGMRQAETEGAGSLFEDPTGEDSTPVHVLKSAGKGLVSSVAHGAAGVEKGIVGGALDLASAGARVLGNDAAADQLQDLKRSNDALVDKGTGALDDALLGDDPGRAAWDAMMGVSEGLGGIYGGIKAAVPLAAGLKAAKVAKTAEGAMKGAFTAQMAAGGEEAARTAILTKKDEQGRPVVDENGRPVIENRDLTWRERAEVGYHTLKEGITAQFFGRIVGAWGEKIGNAGAAALEFGGINAAGVLADAYIGDNIAGREWKDEKGNVLVGNEKDMAVLAKAGAAFAYGGMQSLLMSMGGGIAGRSSEGAEAGRGARPARPTEDLAAARQKAAAAMVQAAADPESAAVAARGANGETLMKNGALVRVAEDGATEIVTPDGVVLDAEGNVKTVTAGNVGETGEGSYGTAIAVRTNPLTGRPTAARETVRNALVALQEGVTIDQLREIDGWTPENKAVFETVARLKQGLADGMPAGELVDALAGLGIGEAEARAFGFIPEGNRYVGDALAVANNGTRSLQNAVGNGGPGQIPLDIAAEVARSVNAGTTGLMPKELGKRQLEVARQLMAERAKAALEESAAEHGNTPEAERAVLDTPVEKEDGTLTTLGEMTGGTGDGSPGTARPTQTDASPASPPGTASTLRARHEREQSVKALGLKPLGDGAYGVGRFPQMRVEKADGVADETGRPVSAIRVTGLDPAEMLRPENILDMARVLGDLQEKCAAKGVRVEFEPEAMDAVAEVMAKWETDVRTDPVLRARSEVVTSLLEKSGLASGIVTDQAGFEAALREAGGDKAEKLIVDGLTYGFTDGDKVYLNPAFFGTKTGLNTPIHEFGHLGIIACRKVNRPLYDRGVELIKQTKYWKEVIEHPDYKNDNPVKNAEEALTRLIADRGEKLSAETPKGVLAEIKQWLVEFWKTFGDALGLRDITPEQVEKMTVEQIADAIRAEMLRGERFGTSRAQVEAQRQGGRRLKAGQRKRSPQSYIEAGGGKASKAFVFWAENGRRIMNVPKPGEFGWDTYNRLVLGAKNPTERAWIKRVLCGDQPKNTRKQGNDEILMEFNRRMAGDGDEYTLEVGFERMVEEFLASHAEYEKWRAEGAKTSEELRAESEELPSGGSGENSSLFTLHSSLDFDPAELEEWGRMYDESRQAMAEAGQRDQPDARVPDDAMWARGGVRFSRGQMSALAKSKVGGWVEGTSADGVRNAIEKKIEDGLREGAYRFKNAEDRTRLVKGAVKFYKRFAQKTVMLSDGRCAYFVPDARARERGLSNEEAWAEYAIHAVTSSGKKLEGKEYAERLYNATKAQNIWRIENILKAERCEAKIDDNPERDAVIFFGRGVDGKIVQVITRLDERGNIYADLSEVTMLNGGKMKKLPPRKPLTEVVEAVANRRQRGGLLTADAESIPQSGGGGNGDLRFSIGGVYTGTAADYANRSRQGGKDDGPSLKKIGTGEGSQVYGWGLYGSAVRGVAEGYAGIGETLYRNKNTGEIRSLEFGPKYKPMAMGDYDYYSGNVTPEAAKKGWERISGQEHLYEQTFFTDRAPGDESHLLKWYEPVSEEQIEWIRSHFNENQEELISDWMRNYYNGREGSGPFALDRSAAEQKARREWEEALAFNNRSDEVATGKDVYTNLSEILGPQAASEFLARAGIDGVKYPVDSYGGKGVKDGDVAGWNYVSFRDDNIRVDHKWVDGQLRFSRGQAPNGKRSNLDEKQYAEVRTPEFKRYFGDWERAAKGAAIRSQKTVTVTTRPDGVSAREAYSRLSEGENVHDGRKARFVMSTLGKILRHKGYPAERIVHQLKEIYDNAIPIGFQEERVREGHKKHPNFVGYHNYVGKIADAGKEYYVRITVQEERTRSKTYNPNSVHSTFVSDVELYKESDLQKAVASDRDALSRSTTSVGERERGPITDRILADFLADGKGASKVVDENGEPLVVYRGAPYDPLAQEAGKGVIKPEAYFTTDPEYARRYTGNGGKVGAYYLNIRRPFDIRDPECLKDLQSIYPDHEFIKGKSGALDWGEASIVDGEFLRENFGDKYDGIIYDEGGDPTESGARHRGVSYVPLDGGAQVKSATDNIGTFDSGNPDIRFSRGGYKPGDWRKTFTFGKAARGAAEQTNGGLAAGEERRRWEENPVDERIPEWDAPQRNPNIAKPFALSSAEGVRLVKLLGGTMKKPKAYKDAIGVIDESDEQRIRDDLKAMGFFKGDDFLWAATATPAEVEADRADSQAALDARLEKLGEQRLKGEAGGGNRGLVRVSMSQVADLVLSLPAETGGNLGNVRTLAQGIVRGFERDRTPEQAAYYFEEARNLLDWFYGRSAEPPRSAGTTGTTETGARPNPRKVLARAFGAFLEAPDAVAERAPGLYREFVDAISRNDKLLHAFDAIRRTALGEGSAERVYAEIEAGRTARAEEAARRLADEVEKPIGSRLERAKDSFVYNFDDMHGPIFMHITRAQKRQLAELKASLKAGRITQADYDAATAAFRQAVQGLKIAELKVDRGTQNEIRQYLWDMSFVFEQAKAAGVDPKDAQRYMDLRWIVSTGGRAGARGMSARDAQIVLDNMKRNMGDEAFARLEGVSAQFHAVREKNILDDPRLAAMIGQDRVNFFKNNVHYVRTERTRATPEELAKMESDRATFRRENKGDDDVTAAMLSLLDKTGGRGGGIGNSTWGHALEGSVKDVKDRLAATWRNDTRLMAAMERNDFVIQMRDALLKAYNRLRVAHFRFRASRCRFDPCKTRATSGFSRLSWTPKRPAENFFRFFSGTPLRGARGFDTLCPRSPPPSGARVDP